MPPKTSRSNAIENDELPSPRCHSFPLPLQLQSLWPVPPSCTIEGRCQAPARGLTLHTAPSLLTSASSTASARLLVARVSQAHAVRLHCWAAATTAVSALTDVGSSLMEPHTTPPPSGCNLPHEIGTNISAICCSPLHSRPHTPCGLRTTDASAEALRNDVNEVCGKGAVMLGGAAATEAASSAASATVATVATALAVSTLRAVASSSPAGPGHPGALL